MEKYFRPLSMVVAVGAIAGAIVFAVSNLPPAIADEQPMKTLMSTGKELFPSAIDVRHLYFAKAYSVQTEPGVSLAPISTQTIRKIGYGKTKFVTITTTSSGVYSNDAMLSPHVRYPGIHVEKLDDNLVAALRQSLSYWSPQQGWVTTPSADAGSFVSISGGTAVFVEPLPADCGPAPATAC